MQSHIHKIQIEKTARYISNKPIEGSFKEIWILCHGYAENVNNFFNCFEALSNNDVLLIAPEGLNRFYTKGFNGGVGATWMTQECREDEIHDYVRYLDNILNTVLSTLTNKPQLNVLGFSQGAATVCRWANFSKHTFNKLILYAAAFPPDLNLNLFNEKTKSTELILTYSNTDIYISPEEFKNTLTLLEQNNTNFKVLYFEGGHKITSEVLTSISK